jgi:hypothetical protein
MGKISALILIIILVRKNRRLRVLKLPDTSRELGCIGKTKRSEEKVSDRSRERATPIKNIQEVTTQRMDQS